jgi:glycerol-3-phosphate dehydrogenase
MHQVAEGVHTARAVHRLARELHIEAPIMMSIYRALFEGEPVAKAVARFTGQVQRTR